MAAVHHERARGGYTRGETQRTPHVPLCVLPRHEVSAVSPVTTRSLDQISVARLRIAERLVPAPGSALP